MQVRILPESDYLSLPRPRGLTDKASVSEAEDCGFESRRGYHSTMRMHLFLRAAAMPAKATY